MDIWAWVNDFTEQLEKDGEPRLAFEIRHLPSLVVDNRHDEVDRMVPGLLAAARNLKHRWLEVYVRHWNLQSRVLQRSEVKGVLPEAVDLLDFANQEDTRSCPQSICVVQDLASCYAETDGPGYGKERLDVAQETLARIDPTWPCFQCISSEYASALLDLGRHQEALDFCHQQLAATGPSANPYDFRGAKVEALIALGRFDEALAFNGDAENPGEGESWTTHKAIDQSRILSRLGRYEEAKAILPAFEAIIDTPSFFRDWCDATEQLIRAGQLDNDWEIDLLLRVMGLQLEDNGALRNAWIIHRRRVGLSLDRGRPWVARHAVQAMRRVIKEMERPLDAPAETDAVERRVAEAEASAQVEVLDTPEANLSVEGSTPDVDYERLRRALERWPESETLWLGWSRSAGMLGRASEIVESGKAFTAKYPAAWQVSIVVGQTMVALGDVEAADAWAEETFARVDDTESQASARFVQALAAERRGDRDGLEKRLQDVIALDPDARNSRSMLAQLARDRGDYDVALEHLNRLVALDAEGGAHHWDRIVAATMEDRWDLVRESSVAIGMELPPGEGPIEENWGVCRVQLRDPSGGGFELHAVRTGPVTARIIEISPPDLEQQFYGASVVFDPRPLNPPDPDQPESDNAQEERPPLTFPLLDVLHASAYRAFAIDGVKPSDVHFDALRSDLEAKDIVVQVRSGDDYRIEHATDGSRDAAYWYIAVPERVPLEAIDDRLVALDAALNGPLVWPELVRALGQEERLADQLEAVKAWKLM